MSSLDQLSNRKNHGGSHLTTFESVISFIPSMEDVIHNIRNDSYDEGIGTFIEDVKRIYR